LAAAAHDPAIFYADEEAVRAELGYPPYGRLANILIWGKEQAAVAETARTVFSALSATMIGGWQLLGPSPAPISRVKGVWRWHILVKAPRDADISSPVGVALKASKRVDGVAVVADVDPVDLL